MTFTATTADTRTSLDENGKSIIWSTDDYISVFDGQGNQSFQASGSGRTVEFQGEAAEAGVYYALYPYNHDAEIDETTVTTSLPAVQTPAVGTFANGLNISAAKTENGSTTFHFSNVMSVAKFTIASDALGGKTIKTVKFTSTHPLAGDVLINYGETFTATAAGTNNVNEITMTDADGFADGTYYFVVLPNEGGAITMTFESTDGCTASISANLGKPFTSGVIKSLGTVGGLIWKEPIVENFNSSTVKGSTYGNNDDIDATSMSGYDYRWTSVGAAGKVFKYGVKLGSSSKSGEISSSNILSSIPAGSTFTVRVYAAVWGTDGGNLVVTYNNTELEKAPSTSISAPDNRSYSASDFGEPAEFVFTKTANDNVLYVGSSQKRILIDKIEIVDGGSITPVQTLTITPASDNPETVPSAGGVLNYTVTTENINTWSVDSDDAAFVPEKTADGFKVTVAPNTDSTPRSATITVTGGDKTETVTINQSGFVNIENKTIQQFIEAHDTDTEYRLTGTVTSAIENSSFNRFTLSDATGSIVVYNLDDVSNFVEGDIVTLYGKYKLYNSIHEVVDGVYESHITTPKLNVSVESIDALSTESSKSFNIIASDATEWSVTSENSDITFNPTSGNGNATVTVTFSENILYTERTATIMVSSVTENAYKNREIAFVQSGKIGGKPVTFTVPESESFTGNKTSIALTYNNVTITQTKHGNTDINTNYIHPNTLRVYQSHELSFSSDYYITSVVLEHGSSNNGATITANVGDMNAETNQTTWSGQAKNVVLTMGSQLRPTSITITYLDPNGTISDPTLSIDDDFSLVVGQTKTLSVNTDSDGAISYSSSNTTVATVVDGVVTAIAPGTATITVNVAASEWFNAASESFDVTVSSGGGDHGEVTISAAALTNGVLSSNGFTLTFAKNNGTTEPTYNSNGGDIRLYAKGTVTVDAGSKNITSIVFNISDAGKKRLAPITANVGTVATQSSGDETVSWSGSSSAVTFTVGDKADYGSDGSSKAGQLCFSSVTITY